MNVGDHLLEVEMEESRSLIYVCYIRESMAACTLYKFILVIKSIKLCACFSSLQPST